LRTERWSSEGWWRPSQRRWRAVVARSESSVEVPVGA
jgi:hypothetical protein